MSLRERCQAFLVLGALVLAWPAWGQEPVVNFNIPAQGLAQALDALSRQGQVEIISDGTALKNKQTPGLVGSYTVREAVEKVLAGSGLAYTFTANNAVAIKKPEPVAENDPADNAPKKPEAPTAKPEEEIVTLPEMTVTASPLDDTSYNPPNATTATKTDTPIFDTPVSIQVVPRKLMDDQQVITLQDALRNVSGVQYSASYQPYNDFIIRGFNAGTSIYRDGFRIESYRFETANLDRVEVLKGPAAVLYGRTEPGGLINLVPKRPLPDPYYSVQQQFGSFDLYRTTVDATGPIAGDGSLLYRFNLAYQNSDSFADFAFLDRIFVAPSLTWRITDDTDLTVEFEYQKDDELPDYGIPVTGNRVTEVPRHTYLGDPVNSKSDSEREGVESTLTHRFNANWRLAHRFFATLIDYDQSDVAPQSIRSDGRTVDRVVNRGPQSTDFYGTNLDLIGRLATGPLDHNLLVGFDFFRQDNEGRFRVGFLPEPLNSMNTVDLFHPAPNNRIAPEVIQSLPDNFLFLFQQTWYGLYFQDQIDLWDKFHILGGGRYDWAETRIGCCDPSSSASIAAAQDDFNNNEIRVEHFSPRVGLSYQPWPWLSLYGNYTESFGANNGLSESGNLFPPETAQGYEVGFKTELWGGQLNSTVAFFDLTKQNILTADPQNPFFSIAVGEARSQGIEVDIAGRVTDSLSLIATYALTDTEITRDNSGNQGHHLAKVPFHSGSLWASYEFYNGPLSGLGLGMGVYLVDEREGNTENTFKLPGYGRLDAFAAYKFALGPTRLTAQVNVNNLTDETYYTTTGFGVNYFGAPRSVLGSIRIEF